MDRKWSEEVEKYLKSKYLEVLTNLGLIKSYSALTYRIKLEQEESKYFMLGLENGIFTIDNEGYAQSSFLPKQKPKEDRQKTFQMFWNKRRHLFREGICQLSAASRLILRDGWCKTQILMEPNKEEVGNLAYGVDLLIKSPEGKTLICGEVKRDQTELMKLIEGFRNCCSLGSHKENTCNDKNHPKYAICAFLRPLYFWAVSPNQEAFFKLEYHAKGKIKLEVLDTFPNRETILNN